MYTCQLRCGDGGEHEDPNICSLLQSFPYDLSHFEEVIISC